MSRTSTTISVHQAQPVSAEFREREGSHWLTISSGAQDVTFFADSEATAAQFRAVAEAITALSAAPERRAAA